MRRTVDRYDPREDLRRRWPGWTIQPAQLPRRAARAHAPSQLVLVDQEWWAADRDAAAAYVVALLDLDNLGRPPADWVKDAAWLGQVRLDRAPGVDREETDTQGLGPGGNGAASTIPR